MCNRGGLLWQLAHGVMESEKSHVCHLQAREPGTLVV